MKKIFGICSGLVLLSALTITGGAAELTDELIDVVAQRAIQAVQNYETFVDLSDLDLKVMMYSDRFDPSYKALMKRLDQVAEEYGSFQLGSHTQTYCGIGPDTTPSADNPNPYGVGKNDLTSLGIQYDHAYFPDNVVNPQQLQQICDTASANYNYALERAGDEMSDVEKALALYDYVILASDYPEGTGEYFNGFENYEERYYTSVNLFYEGKSVCMGYATAYCQLLGDAGITAIMVDSEDMNHVWVMLQLDGQWYHADPTWDDPRFDWGYTHMGEYNQDDWDLSNVGHAYFLKSDEEMNELSHYNWNYVWDPNGTGISEIPVADHSGAWDEAFFGQYTEGGQDNAFLYVDGTWYHQEYWNPAILAYTKGTTTRIEVDGNLMGVQSDGRVLYLNTGDKVDILNLQTMERTTVLQASDYGYDAFFSELRVINHRLDAVVLVPMGQESWHSVEVSTSIEGLGSTPFRDVKTGDWFCKAVLWALENGVTAGFEDGRFRPDVSCTREQIVQFLYNRAGKPTYKTVDNPFSDVAEGAWYYDAVMWAVENQITAGMGDGTFGIGSECTRAQVVTFLRNASEDKDVTITENHFTDVTVGDWFYTSVQWAVERGITAGMGDGTFGANNPCTRAQIVQFMMNSKNQ